LLQKPFLLLSLLLLLLLLLHAWRLWLSRC
jgi:hypothetical protein